MPAVPLLWLVYECISNPHPTLRWLVFRGLIPFGGGMAVFVGANVVGALTASADEPARAAPFAQAIDPFGWLFGSVTLGCSALGDSWGALSRSDALRQNAAFCALLVFFALLFYGITVHRRGLMQPGQFKPLAALAALALSVAGAMVGEAHRVNAILYNSEHAQQPSHPN
jgi:hypothetical protein